jgi:hypothetical protein
MVGISIAGLWHGIPLWLPGSQPARWLWLVAYICIHMCVSCTSRRRRAGSIVKQPRGLVPRRSSCILKRHAQWRADSAFSADAFVSGRAASGGMGEMRPGLAPLLLRPRLVHRARKIADAQDQVIDADDAGHGRFQEGKRASGLQVSSSTRVRANLSCGQEALSLLARRKSTKLAIVWIVPGRLR